MKVSLIAAVAENLVIGDGSRMPWHLSSDLKRFRRLTMGKPIIMGRKTFESIGKPLDGRLNIVMTRGGEWAVPEGVPTADSPVNALELAVASGADEVMIIGGGEVYRAFWDIAQRLYLTVVEGDFEGMTRFPDVFSEWGRWSVSEQVVVAADEKNPHGHTFYRLEKPD